MPLFTPIYDAFRSRAQQDKHWHTDETRWEVFEKPEGKKTTRWYLWVFRGREAIIYSIDPTRGYKVAEDFFKDVKGGIIIDRSVSDFKACNGSTSPTIHKRGP